MELALLERPLMRGWLHTATFIVAIPAVVLLLLSTDHAAARVAASLYGASLLLVFGTSAAYHRLAHSPKARVVMGRLDRSMIYLLIVGTNIPLCLVALPPAWGIPLLATMGALAAFGIVLTSTNVAWGRKIASALYLVLGWSVLVASPALIDHLDGRELTLVIVGGLLYTIGFPVLALNRPDPWPRTFGYHEIWHVFTVLAAASHFLAVASIVS